MSNSMSAACRYGNCRLRRDGTEGVLEDSEKGDNGSRLPAIDCRPDVSAALEYKFESKPVRPEPGVYTGNA